MFNTQPHDTHNINPTINTEYLRREGKARRQRRRKGQDPLVLSGAAPEEGVEGAALRCAEAGEINWICTFARSLAWSHARSLARSLG